MIKYYIILLMLIAPLVAQPQTTPTDCDKAHQLITLLEKHHYRPRYLDDHYSEELFDKMIENLDNQGIYFTQEDLKSLENFRLSIDDELKSNPCNFVSALTNVFRQRLNALGTIVANMTTQKFNYVASDSIAIFGDRKTSYAADEAALKKRWGRWLKYQSLLLMQEFLPDSVEANHKANPITDSLEAAIRIRVANKAHCKIQQALNPLLGLEKFVFRQFLNVIAESYDPHTAFFSSEDKQSFETSLSREAGSFGIELNENSQGEIQIARLTPGGSAWRSNKLHKGDILLNIQLESQETPDLTCLDADDLMEMLEKPGNNKITIKVKKSDGKTESVILYKEKLEIDENLIKGFVLEGIQKIGYISLPGFYTEWEQENGGGCADDVAREIIKLKREGIQGLILDLRYNGGGSMTEAMDLAGIFVEEGPLSLYKDRDEPTGLLKDKNRGTIFDEPLVILVNRFSASASEILAAALRDYNRALIVGGSTFGKASGQIILPLNINELVLSEKANKESQDFVKITISRFYRLDGTSHQLSGVIPDIILPDMISGQPYGEEQLSAHLPADTVVKKVYYTPLEKLPIAELSEKNALRNAKNTHFMEIEKLSEALSALHQKGLKIPLNHSIFQGQFLDALEIYQKADQMSNQKSSVFEVKNHRFDQELIHFAPHKKEINDSLKADIQEDIYIQETYNIINDLINLKNK